MSTRRPAFIASLALLVASLGATVSSPIRAQRAGAVPEASTWSGIAPGPFAVGYLALSLRDPSRTLLPDTLASRAPEPRVIPVRLWYPAAASAGTRRMSFATFGDVVDRRDALTVDSLLAQRTHGLHRYAAQKYDRAGGVPLVAADTVGLTARARATRTAARAGIASASGRHPLVVFAGGTAHSVDENVALWEHLASHGYVVAAIPTVANESGMEQAYLPDDAAGLETVTRDLELVIARLSTRPDVDPQQVVAAGFSFGGAAAFVLAARNANVRAVVALDASLIAGRYLPMIRANPLFDVRRIAVPVLEFHRADSASVDLSLLESATRSARTSIEIAGLDHVDFNSYVLLYGPLLEARGARATRDSALAAKAATYRAMVRTTRVFLDGALSGRVAPGDSAALGATGPVWAGVPATTLRVRRWPAAGGDVTDSLHRAKRSGGR